MINRIIIVIVVLILISAKRTNCSTLPDNPTGIPEICANDIFSEIWEDIEAETLFIWKHHELETPQNSQFLSKAFLSQSAKKISQTNKTISCRKTYYHFDESVDSYKLKCWQNITSYVIFGNETADIASSFRFISHLVFWNHSSAFVFVCTGCDFDEMLEFLESGRDKNLGKLFVVNVEDENSLVVYGTREKDSIDCHGLKITFLELPQLSSQMNNNELHVMYNDNQSIAGEYLALISKLENWSIILNYTHTLYAHTDFNHIHKWAHIKYQLVMVPFVENSAFINEDKLVVYVPKAKDTSPIWMVGRLLSKGFWTFELIFFGGVIVIWRMTCHWGKRDTSRCVLDTFSINIGFSIPEVSQSFKQRILVICWIYYSLHFYTALQARYYDLCTNPPKERQRTIQELILDPYVEVYSFVMYKNQVQDLTNRSDIIQLYNNFSVYKIDEDRSIIFWALDRLNVFLLKFQKLRMLKTGVFGLTENPYVAEQKTYFTTYICLTWYKKHYDKQKKMDKWILRGHATGFTKFFERKLKRPPLEWTTSFAVKSWGVESFQIPFIAFGVGVALAWVVFLLEILAVFINKFVGNREV